MVDWRSGEISTSLFYERYKTAEWKVHHHSFSEGK